ncbi:MAG: hypothetical protein LQ351_006709 [Letrouitia transgressa]|nr:MAG: hypothetical protein LQ351_006709 [Letrouitia transgressa]
MGNSDAQRIPVNRFGLTEVFTPSPTKPNIDIVFVHGLNGDPHNTWTSEFSKIFWPAQLLPPILEEEKARVLVYGYDADVTTFTDGASKDKIHNHAEHLVAELAANRRIRKASERPILWVAHSLGGLVLKRALIHSSEIRGMKTEHLRSIFVSTYGISFLGTPHHGSDIAQWGNRLEWICSAVLPKKILDTNENLIQALKTNNETLQNIDRQFSQLMSRFHIYFFHEGKPTNLKGTLRFIVDETSASPSAQDVERAVIQADHSHMCKFENENSPGFDLVVEGIQRYAEEAPTIIKSRWDNEREERTMQKKAAAEELFPESVKGTPQSESSSTLGSSSLGNSTTNLSLSQSQPEMKDTATETFDTRRSKPSEPYFIVPPGFRPNTFFVGFDKELQELDRRLFDRRRRDGTACVLVHGQPGGGKSHLVRQYVNKNKKKFRGGVFWVVSYSRDERYQSYESIFQKAVTRDSLGPGFKLDEDGQSVVKCVKDWFETRQEWLIIFDGVSVETDEDISDLARFVPDSRNSSMIYVSRQRNLESKQRLLRPAAIRIPSLKVEDARKLLFKELHIKKPSEAEIASATRLVSQTDCLPLAIDAISHRIADTHEPLTRYSMKSFAANPKIEGTYNQILDDLQRLGHMEAWNLINILAFFGQHVPVEMLHLGISGLQEISVKSSEDDSKPELNVTFSILMRHALLERNEPDSDVSSSRDSLVEPEPIDMLKIHSVVQSFCLDSLNTRKMLPEWLQHATKLFESSYHAADSKIKQKAEPARVSDYRYYLVHGRRLYDHSTHYESKKQNLAPIRAELEVLLELIEKEIKQLEPSSSQEGVNRTYQVSVFDRTTSSSSSLPESAGARTPHRPSPLPLANETVWGTDVRKPSLESPASIGNAREPRIVNHSPYQGFYDDLGYESDRENLRYTSHPMRQNISESTEIPQTARPQVENTQVSTGDSYDDSWQVVQSARKARKPHVSHDLGSFRPTPARATRAEVNKRLAKGNFAQKQNVPNPESSDARQALSKVHSRSPPPSRSGLSSVSAFWQKKPPLRESTGPTWANVAAGQSHFPRGQSSFPTADLASSVEPLRGRQGNAYSSPLASEFVPSRGAMSSLENSARLSNQLSSQDVSPLTQPPYANQNENYYPRTTIQGPNTAPLPFESLSDTDNPSSVKRRFPPDTRSYPYRGSSASQSPHRLPSSYYPLPAGYYSQPMSRDNSHQSRISAHTEPPRYNPPVFSSSPIQPIYPANFPHTPSSPRDRFPDGRPLRKSPRSDYDGVENSPPSQPPSDPSYSFSSPNLGNGWAFHVLPHSDPSSRPMSRSNSGPGLALDPRGLGILPFESNGVVQFGSLPEVNVEEARRRTSEWERSLERSRERSTGGRRGRDGGSKPYPDINLIPTFSSLDQMEGLEME